MNYKFKTAVDMFRKLPGVGPRQAARFVMALLEKPESDLHEFGRTLHNLKRDISFCTVCFNVSENHKCSVCLDAKRDSSKILVVEKVTDLDSVERTGLYKGLYHVLGGAINPLDGLTPETMKFKELENRINKETDTGKIIELIVATNPTASGETTALYLSNLFQNKNGVTMTRLARGLASGSNLEYADELTLKNALEHRR